MSCRVLLVDSNSEDLARNEGRLRILRPDWVVKTCSNGAMALKEIQSDP
ncbi:MAG: hypothetical protein K1X79_09685 [Oligoflexia bacterium]|nr:hypothetical protein [Oligoflexia bacterium]